jgi:dTDP-4-amino-4,6-dideoxygalactose transaminase
MSNKAELAKLAVNGGPKTRTSPFRARFHFGQEEKDAVNAILDKAIQCGEPSGYNGPEETEYCKEFAEFLGGGYADAVNSGTTAVYVALRAINPEPFTEIIISPITDPGGMMPIVMCNCIPVVLTQHQVNIIQAQQRLRK